MLKIIHIETPDNFNFQNILYSHGWSELPPFEIDEDDISLSYIFTNEKDDEAICARIFGEDKNIKVQIQTEKISQKFEDKIRREIKHILRFDENLSEFYALTKKQNNLKWISETNAGRLLRSPTVFEDLIKTICTTNCSWSLTKNMTRKLVEKLGLSASNGKKSFPNAETMAKQTAQFYRDEIRAGYRSPYFAEVAESVASGKTTPESWLNSELPTAELKKEIKKIKGVGDYAAENLLKLLGRYEGLALDSWLRAQFYKKHNGGKSCVDQQIEDFYEKFGIWSGLAIWCDMTEKRFKSEE